MSVVKPFFLLCMLVIALPSFASSHLYAHAQAVAQSMSALYMKGLSEGSEKYHQEMEFYKQQATDSLVKLSAVDPEKSMALEQQWKPLAGRIKSTYSADYGWDVDSALRRDFRSYLSDLYQLTLTQSKENPSQSDLYQFASVQMESVIARFFDIASVYNGTVSLSNADIELLNPAVITETFKSALVSLAEKSENESISRNIQSAKYKWEFIEESVVNYSDQSAYFLVYATKNKIQKVLDSSRLQLTGNDL